MGLIIWHKEEQYSLSFILTLQYRKYLNKLMNEKFCTYNVLIF